MENKRPSSLKRSSDFNLIKINGQKKKASQWLLLAFQKNDCGHLRYGCTISGKVANAVLRNKLKRWTREFFRLAADQGFNPELDINLVFRPMPKDFYKNLIFKDFEAVLKRAVKEIK